MLFWLCSNFICRYIKSKPANHCSLNVDGLNKMNFRCNNMCVCYCRSLKSIYIFVIQPCTLHSFYTMWTWSIVMFDWLYLGTYTSHHISWYVTLMTWYWKKTWQSMTSQVKNFIAVSSCNSLSLWYNCHTMDMPLTG